MLLFLSSLKPLRKILLYLIPQAVFLPLVAIDQNKNNVIGFAYLKIKRHLPDGTFSASLGIVVDEAHRGKGLGSAMMENLLKLAQQNDVREIFLTVLSDNARAIKLYEKYGFKKIGQSADRWRGKTFEAIIMKRFL